MKNYTTKRHKNQKSERSNSTTNKHTYISSTTFHIQCFLSQGSSNRRGLWGNTGKLVVEDIFFHVEIWLYLIQLVGGKNSERTCKDTWKILEASLKVIFFDDVFFLNKSLGKCWHVTWKRNNNIDGVSSFDPHLVIFGMESFMMADLYPSNWNGESSTKFYVRCLWVLLLKRQEEVDPGRKHRLKPHDSSRSLINEKIHPIIDFQDVSICRGCKSATSLKLLRPEDDDVWSESLLKWCPPCILGGCRCSPMLSGARRPIFFRGITFAKAWS